MKRNNLNQLLLKILFLSYPISGFVSVGLGAFASHSLRSILSPDLLKIFETGNRYQFYHTLAGLISLVLYRNLRNKLYLYSSVFFILGIVLFSGSLYILALTGFRKLGMITPIGGVSFLLGWIFLILGTWKEKF